MKGFAKFALRSVATIIDKIRRISVETMSNIPENHHVNFISILCQKAFTNLQFFLRGFDPPLLFFFNNVSNKCKIGIVGHPLLPQGGDKVAAQQLVKVAMMYVVSGNVRISGKCELFMKNGQKAVMV